MTATDSKWRRYDDFIAELSRHLDDAALPQAKPVGERIREIREARGMSLETLAGDVGIESEMLVQIENEEVSPPLGTLMKLARYLETETGVLVGEEGRKAYSIVRKDEQKPVSRAASPSAKKKAYSYISLASEVKGRHMESYLVKLEPESPELELSLHQGEEFIFVLDGSMKVQLGDDTEVISAGDSIYYPSSLPHLVTAAGEEPALILAVIYSGN